MPPNGSRQGLNAEADALRREEQEFGSQYVSLSRLTATLFRLEALTYVAFPG